VGGEAAFAGMARAGVVDGDERRAPQSRPQHRPVLGAEVVELGGQKPDHLALGDSQAQAGQKRHDPLAGHLAVKMKHQHQTNKMRAAAAHDPRRQRRNQPLPVRRLPPLAPIERRFGLQHQVLNDDLLEALVARACRGLDGKRFRAVDGKLGDPGAAAPLRGLAFLALGPALRLIRRLLHPGGLLRRTRRQMLQPRDLVLQRLVVEPKTRHSLAQLLVLPPQTRHFANQLANQANQLGWRLPFKRIAGARTHPQLESYPFLTSPFRPEIRPDYPGYR
jgi:hypothetical protein